MEKEIDLSRLVSWDTEAVPPRNVVAYQPPPFKWDWTLGFGSVTSVEQLPEECIGFVYIIENARLDKFYIGKKILKHKRTKPPLKGKKRKRVTYVESDWMTYMGSSDETKLWNPADCDREILYLCGRKDEMTYYETKAIFEFGFEDDRLVNSNVMGKFYKKTVKEKFGKVVY